MRVPHFLPLVVIAVLARAGFVPADMIDLKDGTKISGTMTRLDEKVQITGDDGSVWVVSPGDIASVTLNKTVAPADAAKAEWDFEIVQISQSDDLTAILAQHQRFLQKYKDQPIAATVKTSLEDYQRLADAHAIKFHGKWMPKADAEALQRNWDQQAEAALRDYHAGRFEAAIDDATATLDQDSTNPVAQTVLGLAQYQANNLTSAKQSFNKLVTNDPANVVALNNLAVVCWKQKSANESMNDYAKALQLAPDNRMLLDNIAEEIRAQGDPKNSVAVHLNGLWQNAEKKVEPEMAKDNLVRWGAGWISQAEKNSVESMISVVQTHMDQLQTRYDGDRGEVDRINEEIAENDRQYSDALAEDDPARSASDCAWLMGQHNQLSSDLSNAESTVSADQAEADPLQKQMDKLQQVGFTGVERVMNPGDDVNPPPPVTVRVPTAP